MLHIFRTPFPKNISGVLLLTKEKVYVRIERKHCHNKKKSFVFEFLRNITYYEIIYSYLILTFITWDLSGTRAKIEYLKALCSNVYKGF